MEAIRYITDSKGLHSGLVIDFNIAKKMVKKSTDLIALMEDIEDIIAVELSKNEKTLPYQEARKAIFGKSK